MKQTKQSVTKQIVIVDIDGTVAKVGARARFAEQNPPDWTRFYQDPFDDEPIKTTCEFVSKMRGVYDIFFCTSRRECVRRETQIWLQKYIGLTPQDYTLIMRPEGDTRPDYLQKIDCFVAETTAEDRERVAFVLDDSPTVSFHWRKLGYRTFLVS